MIFFTVGTKACSIKGLVRCMSKVSRPIQFESTISTRFPDHQMIYKFPLIRIAGAVNRLKFYQTVVTGISVPATGVLAALEIITTETALIFTTSGIAWCLAFCAIGFLGQNQIGFLYLKDDEKSVKISYADFWGRRRDIDVDVKDLWPLNDLPITAANSFYCNLQRYSTKDTLKFNFKYGNIVDPEKFQLVFGDARLPAKR